MCLCDTVTKWPASWDRGQRHAMDAELYVFLLDGAFHLMSAVASGMEFIIYFNSGFGSAGDIFALTMCGTMFLFHALQLRFYRRHITVRWVQGY